MRPKNCLECNAKSIIFHKYAFNENIDQVKTGYWLSAVLPRGSWIMLPYWKSLPLLFLTSACILQK